MPQKPSLPRHGPGAPREAQEDAAVPGRRAPGCGPVTHCSEGASGPSRERWKLNMQGADRRVETLQLRSGASLVLSRFGPGEPRSFSFRETEDTFGFGFHLRGGTRFDLEDNAFETCALDVWAAASPRGSSSRFVIPAEGFRTVSIRFEAQVAEAFFADEPGLPPRVRELLTQARERSGSLRLTSLRSPAVNALQRMLAMSSADAAQRLYLESCALELLAQQIVGLSDSCVPEARLVTRHEGKALAARDYLDRNFQAPPTIAELSRIVGTNEFTLKRAFKRTLGTTIYDYVSRCRMERAMALLDQGMSVSATARHVGYGCARSFSVAFRRRTGCAPSSFRRPENGSRSM